MAKYGSFKYGTTKKYGTSAATQDGEVTWILQVDWDDDGIFDGTNEADRLIDMKLKRGSEHYIQTGGNGFEPIAGGTAVLTLDNYDRRYDPRNASGPLYPNVAPGHQVYIGVIDNSDQTRYDVLYGVIDDIRPIGGLGTQQLARIIVADYMKVLNDTKCTSGASQIFTTVSNAIIQTLSDIQFKGWTAIDPDDQPVPNFDAANKNAGEICQQVAAAGLGIVYATRNGVVCFNARNHATFTSHTITQAQCKKDILVSQPWDVVYNRITVLTHRPFVRLPAVIYFLPNPIQLTNGVNVTLNVKYGTSRDVQVGAWKGNTSKDGNGTDKTNFITLSPTLGYTGGTVIVIPAADCWLTQLEIRGRQFDEVQEEFVATDATSIATYGIKDFRLDNEFLQDPNYADSFADTIKDFLKDDRENITIQIQQRPSVQYPIDVMHSVDFTAATLDIDDTYYITGYEHSWDSPTGQDVTTTIYMHKIITDSTSITPSEVLVENEVPAGYENPPGDDTVIDEIVPTASIAYMFVPALGGSNGTTGTYPEDIRVWNGGPKTGTWQPETYAGILFDPSDNPTSTYGAGAFIVPNGVTSVTIYPLLKPNFVGGNTVGINTEAANLSAANAFGTDKYGVIYEDFTSANLNMHTLDPVVWDASGSPQEGEFVIITSQCYDTPGNKLFLLGWRVEFA